MDTLQKLSLFAKQMDLEPAEEIDSRSISLPVVSSPGHSKAGAEGPLPCGLPHPPAQNTAVHPTLPIHNARMPDGTVRPLLKTLLTSACERNCFYCPFRAGRNYRRVTFKPAEMAGTFMDMYRAGLAEGIFLSSGIIKGGVATQDRLLETADVLRHELGFQGYLHLKLMPGAEKAQVERAMQLANRLSINLEAPNTSRLQQLAPLKQFSEELLQPLKWVEEIRRSRSPREGWQGRWPSTVTQFVVGAVGETDVELLTTADYLYNQLRLRRTYFSAFSPITDTPFAGLPPAHPWREHRLYQASFLLRDYGFHMEEMPFSQEGNLPLDVDPKLGWARAYLVDNPVELNRADKEMLLRVPGIGPKGADTIVTARRQGRLRDLQDLRRLGVITTRLAPFVVLDGHRPPHQLRLF